MLNKISVYRQSACRWLSHKPSSRLPLFDDSDTCAWATCPKL